MHLSKTILSLATCCSLLFVFCKTEKSFPGPPGYDLSQPEKIPMPHSLDEISGICFLKDNRDDLFAIEDEDGKLFRYTFSTKKHSHSKFFSKGDFEDIAVLQDSVFVILKSNGSLYTFPVADVGNENLSHVQEYNSVLPKGEYEGLAAKNGRLYILCKDCPGSGEKKHATVYEVILPANPTQHASVTPIGISFSKEQREQHAEKKNFRPSCLAFNPLTNEWYMISSVNKVLVVMDEAWNVKAQYKLDPSLFKQPEGLTFAGNGDMYISNEAAGGTANVLLFKYSNPLKK